MERIDKQSAYFLILKYPMLADYIQDAFNGDDHKDLIEFLFGLDTDIVLYSN